MAHKKRFTPISNEIWWYDKRKRIASEYYVYVRENRIMASDIPLLSIRDENGAAGDVSLRFVEGIPVLVHRDTDGTERMFDRDGLGTVNGRFVETMGKALYVENAGLKRDVLASVRKHEFMLDATLRQVTDEALREECKNNGVLYEDLVPNAICMDIILDENNMHPGKMYWYTRTLSKEERTSLKVRTLDKVNSFIQEQHELERLSRYEAESLMAFAGKSISDKFHDWNLLRGELNNRVGNLASIKGECTPSDIATVAVWAERDPRYNPYRSSLGDWIDRQCGTMNVSRKAVNEELAKFGSKMLPVKRPKLQNVSKIDAIHRFGM